MPHAVVIADDLTGAADTGVVFAARGLSAVIRFGAGGLPGADVEVISTESRHCAPAEAAARVRHLASAYPALTSTPLFYKKIDSTLRGHPAAELRALMDACGCPRALVAPAFPAQGRSTRKGRVWVWDVPLMQSAFGRDVRSGDLVEVFAREFGRDAVSLLSLEHVRGGREALLTELQHLPGHVVVADAETDADLAALACAGVDAGIRVFCGAAGLAGAMAEMVTWAPRPAAPPAWHGSGAGVLAVVGSRHPQTLRQVELCEQAGVPVTAPALAWLEDDQERSRVAQAVAGALRNSACAILVTRALPALPEQAQRIAARLAETLAEVCRLCAPAGLVLTGGDVAFACSQRLGVAGEWLRGEVERGVPWGQWLDGAAAGLPVVTKAGGFGKESALLDVMRFLAGVSRQIADELNRVR